MYAEVICGVKITSDNLRTCICAKPVALPPCHTSPRRQSPLVRFVPFCHYFLSDFVVILSYLASGIIFVCVLVVWLWKESKS